MYQSKVRKMCISAIMLALAFVLSYVRLFRMPWGGSVTCASMLPILIVAISCGTGWGLGTAFCFSWLQILQGGVFGWGLTPGMLIGDLLLDFIVAYTVVGLAGIFSRKGLKGWLGGTVMVCVLRFLSHFLAGFIIFANVEQFVAFGKEWVNRPVLYSLCYNGAYMLPEMLVTVAAAAALFSLPQVRKTLFGSKTI